MATELGMEELIRLRVELNMLAHKLPELHDLLHMAAAPEFYWDDTMTLENGILGKFYPSSRIHLPLWMRDGDYKSLVPTIAHELVHMAQYAKKGRLKWAVANNPIWRHWTIEPEALDMERKVEHALGLNYMEAK